MLSTHRVIGLGGENINKSVKILLMQNMRNHGYDTAGVYFFYRCAPRIDQHANESRCAGTQADCYTLKNTSKNWHFCYDVAACG